MIEAAEIIKSTYDGWEENEIKAFQDMLVYPSYSNENESSGISNLGKVLQVNYNPERRHSINLQELFIAMK